MAEFDPDAYLEKKRSQEPFDPDKYLASKIPETSLQTFGRSAASLADTALNAITGTMDVGARALARAYYGGVKGKSLEESERLAQQEGTSPKDVVGRTFGVTGTPGYEGAPLRRLGTAVGQTLGENVIQPIAQATGLPEGYVGDVTSLAAGTVAPGATRLTGQAIKPVASAVAPYAAAAGQIPGALLKAPVQIPKGIFEGLVNKEYNPATSAMVPLREQYYPQAAVERFMGRIPGMEPQTLEQLQSQARPTSELINSPLGRAAKALAPTTPAGEPLVPYAGRGMEAFGERVGRGIRTNPLQAMGEVGLTALTGIPFKTIGQGIGEAGAAYLGQKTGFVPGFPERLQQAQSRSMFQPNEQLRLPAPGPQGPAGPVAPPPMYVSPEGIAGTNINQVSQAGAMSKYPPMPTPADLAAQRSAQVAQTSGNVVQQQAAQQVAGLTPEQQLAQKLAGQPGYQPPQSLFAGQPAQPKPVAQPAPAIPAPVKTTKTKQPTVEPTTTEGKIEAMHIEKPTKGVTFGETFDKALKKHTKEPGSATWSENRAGLSKGGTIENIVKKKIDFPQNPDFDFTHGVRLKNGEQFVYGIETSSNSPIIATDGGFVYKANPKGKFEYYKQYDKFGEVAKTPKPSKKTGPSNVSQMMVDDDVAKTFNALKSAGESPLEQKIAGMTQVNRDRLEANIRQAAKPGDPVVQEYLNLFEKYRIK